MTDTTKIHYPNPLCEDCKGTGEYNTYHYEPWNDGFIEPCELCAAQRCDAADCTLSCVNKAEDPLCEYEERIDIDLGGYTKGYCSVPCAREGLREDGYGEQIHLRVSQIEAVAKAAKNFATDDPKAKDLREVANALAYGVTMDLEGLLTAVHRATGATQ